MKLATYAVLATLAASGTAFAGGGAPVPEGSQEPDPSGRPSAVLDDAKCQTVWKMASPDGNTLSQDKAVPFVVNFQMVATDKDGKISADEFKTGCRTPPQTSRRAPSRPLRRPCPRRCG